MKPTPALTPGAALLFGLLFVASGIFPMLAAFDIGPLGRDDIQGPPWLGFAAGGTFVATGLAIIAGPRARLLNSLFAILALAGLAAMGNWVAYGAGARACSGSLALPWLWGEGDFSGLACRIPFGIGAAITDAFLFWMVVATLQKALGGPPRLARLLRAARGLILVTLLPILLPLLLFLVAGVALGALWTRLVSGAWPRNAEFIARQKLKALRPGGRKASPADADPP